MPVELENVVPVGTEFLVNTITANHQRFSDITTLSDGRFVVTWEDTSATGGDTSYSAIRAQVFNADGSTSGAEFLANTTATYYQYDPVITGLSDGRFVVTWVDWSGTSSDTSGRAIRAQVFNANGSTSGAEFQVNTVTTNDQVDPAITALSDGRFVVIWQDYSQAGWDTTDRDIRAQVFNADGSTSGAEFLVNTTTSTNHQYAPAVTTLSDGRFVVTWDDYSQSGNDTSSAAIRAQIFNANGSTSGAEFLVNTTTGNGQYDSAITALPDGRFVVTWTDFSQSGGDISGDAIRAQVFNADGSTSGAEFLVNTITSSNQFLPAITALSDGRFVVVWTGYSQSGSDTSGDAIRAQVFNADGSTSGAEFLVNTATGGNQHTPAVTALSGGRFVVTWTDNNSDQTDGDTSGSAIRAQIFYAGGETITLDAAADIFAAEGQLAFFADLALGAYHLAEYEPRATNENTVNTASNPAYDSIGSTLYLLGASDLTSLSHATFDQDADDVWWDGLGSTGTDRGIYTNQNSAALVGRSEDAIFLSFRGTNSSVGLDHVDWATRNLHFDKILPLLEAIQQYVTDQNAAGGNITKIYLTGHSLGAAMVQPAYEWLQKHLVGITVEGLTFASPGYGLDLLDIDDDPSVNITNFWNALDIIQVAANASEILGDTFTFNNALENLLDGVDPLTAHSMVLYKEIADMLLREGREEVNAPIDLEQLQSMNIERISVSIQEKPDGSFTIGDARDFVIAGVFEASLAAINLLTTPIGLTLTTAKATLTGAAAAVDIVSAPITDPTAENAFDAAKTFFAKIGSVYENRFKILYSAVGLEFLVDSALDLATSLFHQDLLIGGARNDVLYGLGGKDVIFGGAGNDALFGGIGADKIYGGDGNDTLNGGWGKDVMTGGGGNDLFFVNKTNDVVIEYANQGIDTVISSADYTLSAHVENLYLDGGIIELNGSINGTGNTQGNVIVGDIYVNELVGNGGRDFLYGGDNNDTLHGGTGGDFLFGGLGNDKLFGNNHADMLAGGWGKDILRGGGGQDTLYGGKYEDKLFGGDGWDTLDGGGGKDKLTGGRGADTFVFSKAAEVKSDIIFDFQTGNDHIDLSGIAEEMGSALMFAGASQFTSTAGEVMYQKKSFLLRKDFTWIKADLDGDDRADIWIKVMGLHDFQSTDFIM